MLQNATPGLALRALEFGEKRNAYRTSVGKAEGDRPRGRPRRRLEDSIKIALREIIRQRVEWIHLVQDWDTWQAFMKRVKNIRVPRNAENFLNN